jgi:hypothetical protein
MLNDFDLNVGQSDQQRADLVYGWPAIGHCPWICPMYCNGTWINAPWKKGETVHQIGLN